MLKARDTCWGQEHGARGAAPWTLRSSESGVTNQKAGAGGKEKNPGTNQRELRRETDGDGGGALQSSCLGSASSHCGHERATATVEQSTGQLPRCMPTVSQRQQARPPATQQQPGPAARLPGFWEDDEARTRLCPGQQLQPLWSYLVLGRKGPEVG